MERRLTIIILILTLLVLGVDHYMGLGLTSALSDFLVVFIAVGIVLGIIYSKGD